MHPKYHLIRWACYAANISMSSVIIMPALLFANFQSVYGISYTLLGLLVFINFSTQLVMDLIFTFFAHRFHIPRVVKSIPLIALGGFFLYATLPILFPTHAYLGLVAGTVVFSAASGLAEVLISPVVAAIPAENPEKEMSKLHSMYAWGVVGVTLFSTTVLYLLPAERWYVLVFLMMFVPLSSSVLFWKATLPPLDAPVGAAGENVLRLFKSKEVLFCVCVIFFGGASENIMSQWSSSYLEQVLHLPKIWGDMLGVSLFATMLGVGRSLYAHSGKNLHRTMLFGAAGATLCYAALVFIDLPIIGILACAMTGFFVAMLWPGSLILVQEAAPTAGVAVFALMASGGDLGSAFAPQLVGLVTDAVMLSEPLVALGASLGYTPAQIGMKCGLLVAMLFPLMATILLAKKHTKKQR